MTLLAGAKQLKLWLPQRVVQTVIQPQSSTACGQPKQVCDCIT